MEGRGNDGEREPTDRLRMPFHQVFAPRCRYEEVSIAKRPCPDGASAFKVLMTSATARDRLPEEKNGRSAKSALYQDVVKHLKVG